jgi:hypothetical protein
MAVLEQKACPSSVLRYGFQFASALQEAVARPPSPAAGLGKQAKPLLGIRLHARRPVLRPAVPDVERDRGSQSGMLGHRGRHVGLGTSIPSARLIRLLSRLLDCYGAPDAIRLDNGPELVSQAFTEWAAAKGIAVQYMQPGKPNQNALSVSAGVILTHFAGVKVTHLGDDGGHLAAGDVASGASSGDKGIGAPRIGYPGDRQAVRMFA